MANEAALRIMEPSAEVVERTKAFLLALEAYCNEKNINSEQYKIVIKGESGRLYTKVIRYEHVHGEKAMNPYGGVHCFIRNEDGAIMKAASFLKVAPNGERGSIFSDGYDIGRAVNQFGCVPRK